MIRKKIRNATVYLKNKITLDMNQASNKPKIIKINTNDAYSIPEEGKSLMRVGFGEYDAVYIPRTLKMSELVDFVLAKINCSDLKSKLIVSSILLNSKEIFADDG